MSQGLNKKAGTSLLETVIAAGLFLIIAASGTTLLLYANDVSGQIMARSELLENARITLDFIVNQLRLSDTYFIVDNDGIMQSINLSYPTGESSWSVNSHEFTFDKERGIVTFGNQPLAAFIDEVRVEFEGNCLIIYVTTFDRISDTGIVCEPITLKGTVNLENKISKRKAGENRYNFIKTKNT